MRISVQTTHPVVVFGLQHDLPSGVSVTAPPVIERRGVDIPQILELIIDASWQVDIGLLAAWLYGKVSPSKESTRLQINRVEVLCDEGEIRRVIAEQIREERSR